MAGLLLILTVFIACPQGALPPASSTTVPPAVEKCAVTFSVDGSNGSLSATVDGAAISSGALVEKGKTVSFSATPAAGFKVNVWTGATQSGTDPTKASLVLAAAATVKVSFVALPPEKYAVTFRVQGSNGSLSATVDGAAISSGALVEKGKTVTLSATPSGTYEVDNWIADGAALSLPFGEVPRVISFVVTGAATIQVAFIETFPVTFAVVSGGSGSGSLTASLGGRAIVSGARVKKGSVLVFTAGPDATSVVKEWGGTPLEFRMPNVNNGTLSSVDGPVSVTVSFVTTTPKVNYGKLYVEGSIRATLEDGSTIVEPGSTVPRNTKVLFTATPKPDYYVAEWRKNGVAVPGTFTAATITIDDNTTVEVTFQKVLP